MPGAVRALAALGVVTSGRPFRGIRYVTADGSRSADALFRGAPGMGVRRTELARGLADRAELAGVAHVQGVVGAVRQDRDGVEVAGVRGRWLLAADGLHSVVRHQLGLERPGRAHPRWGLRRHFAVTPWTDLVEVHWGAEAEAYVTPVGDGCVGVAVLTSRRGRPYDEWLDSFPSLRARLRGAEPSGRVLGAGPLEQVVARRVDGRVLLVGDAAGYVDALTGEGVALGLAQATAAVACIVAGRPLAYEGEWRRATRRYRLLTRAVLGVAQQDRLRRAVVPAAVALPAVYGVLVRALA